MATAFLEQVKISAGESHIGKKQPLSLTKNQGSKEFADLVKEKPKLVYSINAERSSKNLKPSDKQKVSDDQEPKVKQKGEDKEIELETMLLSVPINVHLVDTSPLGKEEEVEQLLETDDKMLGEELIVPAINISTKGEDELSAIAAKPEIGVISELPTSVNIDLPVGVGVNTEGNLATSTSFVSEQLTSPILPGLHIEEGSLIQTTKSFKLPEEFSGDLGLNKNLNKVPEVTTQLVSSKGLEVQNSGTLIKSAVIENISSQGDISAISLNSNLFLADDTRQGQLVLAKMNAGSELESKISLMTQNESNLVIKNEEEFTSQEQDLSESSSKRQNTFDSFGGILEVNSEDLFQVSFRENILSSGEKNNPPKADIQVSLAIKEALSMSTNNVGKKEITINLFPEALGPVRVEIISVLGEEGARKIESIKLVAEKRETLEILEKSRIDLEKNLKEVTNTKEEASLQFEMNHQGKGSAGAYFNSLEERNNWMNNFVGLVAEGEAISGLEEYETQSPGYITEDSINIKV